MHAYTCTLCDLNNTIIYAICHMYTARGLTRLIIYKCALMNVRNTHYNYTRHELVLSAHPPDITNRYT